MGATAPPTPFLVSHTCNANVKSSRQESQGRIKAGFLNQCATLLERLVWIAAAVRTVSCRLRVQGRPPGLFVTAALLSSLTSGNQMRSDD